MKNLYDLLRENGKDDAALWLERFAGGPSSGLSVDFPAKPDLWVVGGAARWLLSGDTIPFPQDIDLLYNIEPLGQQTADAILDQEYDESQKSVQGGVNFDIFRNRLTVWLHGAPCVGDQLAVRLKDNFILCSPAIAYGNPARRNPRWSGGNEEYFARQSLSVARDADVFFELSAGALE